MELNSKIAVIGGGSWATAIVKMLCENELKVGWYMRNSNAIEYIKKHHHNPRYIQAAEFNPKQSSAVEIAVDEKHTFVFES